LGFQAPLKVVLYSPAHKQSTHSVWPPSDCPNLRFMVNARLHVCVINFRIIIIIIKLLSHDFCHKTTTAVMNYFGSL